MAGCSERENLQIIDSGSVQRIGVISDTHGVLENAVLDCFQDVDYILHAGDIGYGRESKTRQSEHFILTKLCSLAPVLAVCGNVDRTSLLPGVQMFHFNHGLIRGVMVHGDKHKIKWSQSDIALKIPPQILAQDLVEVIEVNRVNMVVFGHSHIPGVIFSEGVLYVNPGSAGPKRFCLPRTVALVSFNDEKVMVRICDITKQCDINCLEVNQEHFITSELL